MANPFLFCGAASRYTMSRIIDIIYFAEVDP